MRDAMTNGERVGRIDSAALAARLNGTEELALLDARDESIFARSHLLFSVLLPWSRLEERVRALVPRFGTPIVMTSSASDGLAQRAAARLVELGYTNVCVLDGGIEAWEQAGYNLFGGIHVPSKAFGELVEHACGTPHIDALELKALLDAGADIAVFDSRPSNEYLRMNIPSARNCPGAELVYRLPGVLRSSDTLVVVNCAGRTRSIIGAQSLINAGLPNRVVALKDGTMGWQLAGLTLEHGNSDLVSAPDAFAVGEAADLVRHIRERFGIVTIGLDELARLQAESDTNTLYLMDVRGPAEFEAGHLKGARNAPGGQLVQSTDLYIGTRNSRIVLVDSDDVRATMTASWLLQLGWPNVTVLAADEARRHFDECGPAPIIWPEEIDPAAEVSVQALRAMLDAGEAHLLDLAPSEIHKAGHIAGARFALRSCFATSLARLQPGKTLVLTSEDGMLAHAAAGDAASIHDGAVAVLAGGTRAWREAGLALVPGFEEALDAADDLWQIPSVRGAEAMRDYLSWEVNLISRLEGEPGVCFRVMGHDGAKAGPAQFAFADALPASQEGLQPQDRNNGVSTTIP